MRPRYLELLRLLASYQIDFIVIGGVAAILEGAPVTTLDLDVVFDREPDNLEKLAQALDSVNAHYRDPAGRHIVPNVERLETFRINLLLTDLGPLDVLPQLGDGATYSELLPSTHVRTIDEFEVCVLNLARIISSKEHANRDKDRAVLPVLRKTLELKQTS